MKRVLNLQNCQVRTFEKNKRIKYLKDEKDYNPYEAYTEYRNKFRCIKFNQLPSTD